MDRINKLCAYLDKSQTFADIGCDHGYCTKYMLDNGLCERAVISDISEACLQKAKTLLSDYIARGKVTSVCCSGLEKTDGETEQVLIAGMGGDEIINILKTAYIPRSFVFQPMKNANRLRAFLLESGARITVDEVFESGGKFYTVIKGGREGSGQAYSPVNLEYGLNLRSADTLQYLACELNKKRDYLSRDLNAETRARITEEAKIIEDIINGKLE